MLLPLYKTLSTAADLPLRLLLKRRLEKGKEDPARWLEKTGKTDLPRPGGTLVWLHAASVGESLSALILIEKLCGAYPHLSVLVTTGTLNAAKLLEKRLPERAFHQYVPLDHPYWVRQFLDHWQPDLALWLESELWPNMLLEIKSRGIPAILVNGRLSPSSFKTWRAFSGSAEKVLSAFTLIMCQTEQDATYYKLLGAKNVLVSGNLKYSAHPLPCDEEALHALQKEVGKRPCWVYASTHAGEEELAARLHKELKTELSNLLTIIVPRHPERGAEISRKLGGRKLKVLRRTAALTLPQKETDIYIADTLGELGLFYRLCPIAVIGRSFSNDGGGGHNPIEAAQLNCAVLHGPNVQNLQKIYDDMAVSQACRKIKTEEGFLLALKTLLTEQDVCHAAQARAVDFAQTQKNILAFVWEMLQPYTVIFSEEAAA